MLQSKSPVKTPRPLFHRALLHTICSLLKRPSQLNAQIKLLVFEMHLLAPTFGQGYLAGESWREPELK